MAADDGTGSPLVLLAEGESFTYGMWAGLHHRMSPSALSRALGRERT